MRVGYEMIIANSAPRTLLAIYHLISMCTRGIIVKPIGIGANDDDLYNDNSLTSLASRLL